MERATPTPADDRLRDRRILITGASSGIGAAAARAAVAAGGRVALVARSADALAELAGELGDAAVAVPGDVTDPASMERAVTVAVDALGGLDAVVCSAGVVHPGGIQETGPEHWQATFDVNVLGVLHTVHAALPQLRDAVVGDIVNVSSMSGRRRASVAMSIYAASKFAVHVVSDGLREELAPEGIRVTIVSPGYVRTPIFDAVDHDGLREQYQEALASKGLDPGAVADQIVHALAQPEGVDLLEIAMVSTRQ